MQLFGDINQQGLAMMGGATTSEGDTPSVDARAFDSDGDGRNDMVLVDGDNDGTVDGVVRALDSDGDGKTDTYVQYDEEGAITSIGRVNPMTGQLEVIYEEPDLIDKILDFLGLKDLDSPSEALYTTFDDPYLMETFGSYGSEVSDVPYESVTVETSDITELTTEEYESIEAGVTVVEEGNLADEDAVAGPAEESTAGTTNGLDTEQTVSASVEESQPETQTATEPPTEDAAFAESEEKSDPRIVGIEDRSGDGSSLWAKVDIDGDSLADTETQVSKTSVGEYYADINQDGYSETVAHDMDMDGRIDTVDTAGKGSSTDTVDAERVVDPDSDHMVDRHPGEDDTAAERAAPDQTAEGWEATDIESSGTDTPYEADGSDDSLGTQGTDTSSDVGDIDSGDVGSSYDPGSSYSSSSDSGSTSSYDSGSSTSSYDAGGSTD